jgi:hypothetical protein
MGRCLDCYPAAVQRTRQRADANSLARWQAGVERYLADCARGVYLDRIVPADSIPHGVVVVHNNARPRRRLGYDGFWAWVQVPNDRLLMCGCSWAPEVGVHYRGDWAPTR